MYADIYCIYLCMYICMYVRMYVLCVCALMPMIVMLVD